MTIPETSLFLRISRIFDEGYHEAIEITSFVPEPIDIRFSLFVDCDFETNHEVRGLLPVPPRVTREWYDQSSRTFICDYRNRWFSRRFEYRVVSSTTEPRHAPNQLIFPVQLRHDETWQAEVEARMLG